MDDTFTKEQRSKNMKSIRSTGTTLENKITKELWRRGFRFRRNVRKLLGCPDIAIQKDKIVIFIDSCFWHSCPIHGRVPTSNIEYWEKKLMRNRERDIEVTEYYIQKRWNIYRVWEHEIKTDLNGAIDRIVNFISKSKANS
ncbi:very short patch repair endonuclease [Brevibacillus brevis]|uniref:very short patch repair endonuclease n=1 Tax=Brevibacillus brevis TaxID=1393 RepID=UPI0037C73673